MFFCEISFLVLHYNHVELQQQHQKAEMRKTKKDPIVNRDSILMQRKYRPPDIKTKLQPDLTGKTQKRIIRKRFTFLIKNA